MLMGITDDIAQDLQNMNERYKMTGDGKDLMNKVCEIVELLSDAKQLSKAIFWWFIRNL